VGFNPGRHASFNKLFEKGVPEPIVAKIEATVITREGVISKAV
jgi:hypothetical protein